MKDSLLLGDLFVSRAPDGFLLRAKGMEDLLDPRPELAVVAVVQDREIGEEDGRACADRLAAAWNACRQTDEAMLKRVSLGEVVEGLRNCVVACSKSDCGLDIRLRSLIEEAEGRFRSGAVSGSHRFGRLMVSPEGDAFAVRARSSDGEIPRRLGTAAVVEQNEIFTHEEAGKYATRLALSWNACRSTSDGHLQQCTFNEWVRLFSKTVKAMTEPTRDFGWGGNWRVDEALKVMRSIHHA